MFIRENCIQCGMCLSECPVMKASDEKAKQEIAIMLETGYSKYVDKNCTRCSYCSTVCPTKSNPSDLREEILRNKTRDKGAGSLSLICKEIPQNIMSIAAEYEQEEKARYLIEYENPPEGEEVFFAGCSLTCLYTDLLQTDLLKDLPVIGGIKYCCGNYVHMLFGDEEAEIKGRQLLRQFKKTGVRKIITMCPSCDHMIRSIYPRLVEGFDIHVKSISEYLLEKYHKGEIDFPYRVEYRVAFHDPCAWRNVDPDIYEAPRSLLEIMGAELVEMKHNRKSSLCCGAPLEGKNPVLSNEVAENRILEALEAGAQAIAVSCTGCFSLAKKAAEHNLELYNITELAQIAIGEKPPHRIIELKDRLVSDVITKISESPGILQERYLIRDGKTQRI